MQFLVFTLVTLTVYWLSPPSMRLGVLAVASLVFAFVSDVVTGFLVVAVAAVCFLAGPKISAGAARLRWRNMALLACAAVFVGVRFGRADSAGELATLTGAEVVGHLSLSYFLFHAVSYIVDLSRDRVEPQPASGVVGFVAFFPHMAAGPVMRTRRTFRSFERLGPTLTSDKLVRAVHLILLGVFRKVVIADSVIGFVGAQNELSRVGPLQLMSLVIASYHDIAGYNDIARGVALLFDIDLQANFRQPFIKSTGFIDLWSRWQTTLMQWFRDYVYAPIRGDGSDRTRRWAALPVAVLASSVWHGFSLRWLSFGAILAVLVLCDRWIRPTRAKPAAVPSLPTAVRRSLMLAAASPLITAPLLFTTGEQALGRISLPKLAFTNGFGFLGVWYFVVPWVFTIFLEYFELKREDRRPIEMLSLRGGLLAGGMIVAIVVYWGGSPLPFVYARF